MTNAAVAQMAEQPRRNGQVVGSTPTGGSDATVVLRLVGAATLVGHKAQQGDAKLTSCAGGYGPIILTPEAAADLLLSNRPVRIPADSEQAVRSAIAERALAGRGPEEAAKIWDGRELREDN